MRSSTLIAIATSIFSLSASAAPLRSRSEGVGQDCSPRINGTLSTTISPNFNTRAHWTWLSGEKGPDTTIVVSLPIPSSTDLVETNAETCLLVMDSD